MANKHLIGKKVLQIEIDSAKDAYAIQQRMSELVWKSLAPAISDLFDRLIPEDLVVRMDTIEIDIGAIQLEDDYLEEVVIQKIIDLLEETINERLRTVIRPKSPLKYKGKGDDQKRSKTNKNLFEKGNRSHSEGNYFKSTGKDTIRKYKQGRDDSKRSIQNKHQSLRRHYFEIWLYWLEKGTLPNYTSEPSHEWITLVLETLGLDLDAVIMLEHTLRKTPIALQRLVVQHTTKELKSIVELYTGFSQDKLVTLFSEIKTFLEEPIIKTKRINARAIEISMWRKIFTSVILDHKKLDSFSLAGDVLVQLSVELLINKAEIGKILKSDIEIKRYSFLQEVLQKEAQSGPDVQEHKILDKDKKNIQKEDRSEGENKTEEEKTDAQQENEQINLENSHEIESEKIRDEELLAAKESLESPQFFNNAGMVLLHPFLSTVFNKFELLKENDFVDFKARSKAVTVLHFLATGDENPREYEMVLPKFLCEMPVNMPMDHTVILSQKEKEEANNLLSAVIEHWGALGKVSPDSLREGFLMRQGKLEQEATGWKLYVEQKTMDILLDRLPWNLSIIKLPWMKELLKVEWR
ncbi:contractile injection system tape measure protein [Aquimarina gracilis]|uniref:Contractile injection system tape measure protein n=1 Tax=Aquimarina gracilis TaxID=874422 RepID=A0ABU5ZUR8_9FLAO|nr:contractile injection system tape measure protein [Aquimarina gracilis]MEB3345408.1 contractile injection system tape measure protein [Aquimarina gracilis]